MWSRAELKNRGKAAFRKNYWKCVGVGIILSIALSIFGAGTGSAGRAGVDEEHQQAGMETMMDTVNDMPDGVLVVLAAILGGSLLITMIIGIALGVFILEPMKVGGCKFFIENRKESGEVGQVLYGFSCGKYVNVILTTFFKNLFVMLWTLLLIVPGIIKKYEYYMVPYILADHPEMHYKEVLAQSKAMMMGNKWNVFVLDLSFILWDIGVGFTCGILGVFYVVPYKYATEVELYEELKV